MGKPSVRIERGVIGLIQERAATSGHSFAAEVNIILRDYFGLIKRPPEQIGIDITTHKPVLSTHK